jgi:hypothetical protein
VNELLAELAQLIGLLVVERGLGWKAADALI